MYVFFWVSFNLWGPRSSCLSQELGTGSPSRTRREAGLVGCMKQQQAPKLYAALRVGCWPVACRATKDESAILAKAGFRALAIVKSRNWTRDQASQQHGLPQSRSGLTGVAGRGMSVVAAVLSCARGDRQLSRIPTGVRRWLGSGG